MDEKGKGADHKSDRFPPSSVPILALLPLLLTTSIHLKCCVSFFFHFLFETFLAPPFAAAACSLERMMLFCQIEPGLSLNYYSSARLNLPWRLSSLRPPQIPRSARMSRKLLCIWTELEVAFWTHWITRIIPTSNIWSPELFHSQWQHMTFASPSLWLSSSPSAVAESYI